MILNLEVIVQQLLHYFSQMCFLNEMLQMLTTSNKIEIKINFYCRICMNIYFNIMSNVPLKNEPEDSQQMYEQ